MRKNLLQGFVSAYKTHTPKSIPNDIRLDKLGKKISYGNVQLKDVQESVLVAMKMMQGIKWLTRNKKNIKTGMLSNGDNSITNKKVPFLPSLTEETVNRIPNNDTRIYKTRLECGLEVSGSLKRLNDGVYSRFIDKSLKNSHNDYQDRVKRGHLKIEGGFNQKSFTFFGEDTFVRGEEYLQLFEREMKAVENRKKRKDNNSIEEHYGCVKKTTNNFYFKNRMQGYGVNLKLHIFKIKNNNLSLRDVINNMLPDLYNEESEFDMKAYLKLPKDEILGYPQLRDEDNKYRLDFLTTTECNINLCNSFKNSVINVGSYSQYLSPGSGWKFKFIHKLGKGISIESLNGMSNKDHPTGYIFCLECIGDSRAILLDKRDGREFLGTSPIKLISEFGLDLTYMTRCNDHNWPLDQARIYETSKHDKEFQENDPLYDIFYGDGKRKELFNQNIECIDLKEGLDNKDYILEYDNSVYSEASNKLVAYANKLKLFNMAENVTANDLKFNNIDSGIDDEEVSNDIDDLGDIFGDD